MSIYDEYAFPVEAVHPSGLISYQSGKATTSRKFLMPCAHAEEFCLRMLGKFYLVTDMDTPQLPAPFPFNPSDDPWGISWGIDVYSGQLNMVAIGFNVEPVSGACFNVSHFSGPSEDESKWIYDPTSLSQLERYWYKESRVPDEVPGEPSRECCLCYVTIFYEENPCDCLSWNTLSDRWMAHEDLMPNTCISVERNPSYEMFTLPGGNLIWSDLPADMGPDRRLKQDSFAYKVIPKADIIVSWHNVPVNLLCHIETHLEEFRGCVNKSSWGGMLSCDLDVASSSSSDDNPDHPLIDVCGEYDPETILFIDWQEDRQYRTDAFGGMRTGSAITNRNTTTLKLIFKQNLIPVNPDFVGPQEPKGWNHLWMDRKDGKDAWMRVKVESTGEDLFTKKSFKNIMNPSL